MAGIGEAGAVLSTVQLGLSLAKTLYACVGDYRSAREDIISLATDVEATLTQAQELDDLVSSNEASKLLNKRGLKLAEKCRNDSNSMVQKLLKLLTKAGVPEREAQAISLSDIDVSRFGRAAWVLFKPEVLVAKRELDSIKLQMLVARSCIEAQSASDPADRDAAASRIAGLERSRWLARRLLREAQAENQKAIMAATSNHGVSVAEPRNWSVMSEPPMPVSSRHRPRQASQRRAATGNTHAVPARAPAPIPAAAVPLVPAPTAHVPAAPASLDGDVVERITQQVEQDEAQIHRDQERMRQDIVKQLQQDEKERKAKEVADRLAHEQAIESYKADVRQRLNVMRERSERMRTQLSASFSHELEDAEIEDFINAQNSQELQDDFVALMIDKYKAPPSAPSTTAVNSTTQWSDTTTEVSDDKKGRRFSRLLRSKEKYSGAGLSSVPSTPANPINSARYVHLLLTLAGSKRSILSLENTAFTHCPCGDNCNITRTTKVWARLSEADQSAAFGHLSEAHPLPPLTHWYLHAAWPTGHHSSRRRRLMERALLGEPPTSRNCSFILAFSAAFSWQEMLKNAADSSAQVQERPLPRGSRKPARVRVTESPPRVLSPKVSDRSLEEADTRDEEHEKRREAPARDPLTEPASRNQRLPTPLDDAQRMPHQQAAPVSAPPASGGSMHYPGVHSLVPYGQSTLSYTPYYNQLPPELPNPSSLPPNTDPFGYTSNPFSPMAAPQAMPPYGSSYGSMVPYRSNAYHHAPPYAAAPYDYFAQPYFGSVNPYTADIGVVNNERDYAGAAVPKGTGTHRNRDSGHASKGDRHRRILARPRSRSPRRRREASTRAISPTWTASSSDYDTSGTSSDSWTVLSSVKGRVRGPTKDRTKSDHAKFRRDTTDGRSVGTTARLSEQRSGQPPDALSDNYQRPLKEAIRLPWYGNATATQPGNAALAGFSGTHDDSEDSEAKNATVDDTELSNRMLVKYTNSSVGGIKSEPVRTDGGTTKSRSVSRRSHKTKSSSSKSRGARDGSEQAKDTADWYYEPDLGDLSVFGDQEPGQGSNGATPGDLNDEGDDIIEVISDRDDHTSVDLNAESAGKKVKERKTAVSFDAPAAQSENSTGESVKEAHEANEDPWASFGTKKFGKMKMKKLGAAERPAVGPIIEDTTEGLHPSKGSDTEVSPSPAISRRPTVTLEEADPEHTGEPV